MFSSLFVMWREAHLHSRTKFERKSGHTDWTANWISLCSIERALIRD
jgi:hypothetical protein